MSLALVLGRGFGLYGHAAALAGAGWRVLLPEAYRADVAARPELAHLSGQFGFVDDPKAAFAEVGLICLARRPGDNAALAVSLCERPRCPPLVIEKPIAASPEAADQLADLLRLAGIRWTVPYLFLHTDWVDAIAAAIKQGLRCRILWQHQQAPNLQGWKHDTELGGGALAFYLIHIIALLHVVDPGDVRISRQAGHWLLASERLEVTLQLGDEMGFSVDAGGEQVFLEPSPFGAAPARGKADPRIGPLQRFYAAFLEQPGPQISADLHARIHRTWAQAQVYANDPA